MLEEYKEKQTLLYNYIKKVKETNKISHAYIIETNGVTYGFDLALALSKYFLCEKNICEECNICSNIDLGNYPDIKIIETSTKEIKKDQMIELQHAFSTKPLYGKYLIYIIKNAELLNKSAGNTILKFLEEPSSNIIAILLTDNAYNLFDTIVSRCQVLTLKNAEKEFNDNIFNNYYTDETEDYKNFVKTETDKVIDFYIKIEKNKTKTIAKDNPYEYKEKQGLLLKLGLQLYIEILNKKLGRVSKNFEEYETKVLEISKKNELSDIIKKIDVINQFLEKSNINVNKDLFIDNFIITFNGGIDND